MIQQGKQDILMDKKAKVIVSGVLDSPSIYRYWEDLFQRTDVQILEDNTPDVLKKELEDADVLILRPVLPVSKDMLEAAEKLRGIVVWGVGTNTIDVDAATKHGIPVITLPVFLGSIAEAVIYYLLAVTKKYPQLNKLARTGQRPTLDDRGHALEGKVLGCVGFGRIGRKVARIALAFGMKVLVCDPYIEGAVVDGASLPVVSMDELAEQSHFVSLHVPLTEDNHHMINAGILKKMRKDAFLINLARGGLVDEAALHRALIDGQIAGAALDTFELEPVAPDNPLLYLDNVWATPHYLGATWEGLAQLATAAEDATFHLLQGEYPGYQVVNSEVYNQHGG